MEGRHVHPSTLYPGRRRHRRRRVQLFTDYLVRLMKYVEFMKRVVPLHDDLFDFFYEALPGYEEVGQRRVLLGCWGSFNDPEDCDYRYENMTRLGHARCSSPPASSSTASWSPTTWSTSTSASASCWAARTTRTGTDQEMFVEPRPAGQPGRPAASVEPDTIPRPQKRDFERQVHLGHVAALVRQQSGEHLALDTGGGPIARLWATALAGLVDIGYVKATGHSVQINLPKTRDHAGGRASSGRSRSGRNAIERDRARTYFQAYAAACGAVLRREGAGEVQRRAHQDLDATFKVPDEAIGCGFPEAVRGVLSHHMVIRDGKIANYHPVPADAVERQPARQLRHAGAVRGRGAEHADLRGERAGATSRASTSCGRCAASTPACRAACTCTWAGARRWRCGTRPCWGRWGRERWGRARRGCGGDGRAH